ESGTYDMTPSSEMVEEILRFDPPLHLFTRHVRDEVTLQGHSFVPGDQVGVLLAGAARDPGLFDMPAQFIPTRPSNPHVSFGAGLHFCVGAPLARLEVLIALKVLTQRCPKLRLAAPAHYANRWHFRGLRQLWVED
ncbi:MAG: cytochrome P450, partial [Pseudomonadota bacterium]